MCLSETSRDNDILRNQTNLLSRIISQDQKIVLKLFKLNNPLTWSICTCFIITTLMGRVLKVANAHTIGI